MLRVGLTGGIAAGKSTVSTLLAEHGAVVVDADMLAREAVAVGTPGLAEVVELFGTSALTVDGELDRASIGRLVFDDPGARERLEAIIHPRVRARAAELESAAGRDAVVVHDIPLLVETGDVGRFDAVIVVDAPTQVQVERLISRRGMTPAEAQSRLAAQAPREQRLAVADYVVVNDASRDQLRAAVDQVWAELDKTNRR